MRRERDKRIKEIRKLEKELEVIRWERWRIPEEELEEPIRHGWYCELRLREDIAKRPQAKTYQEILDGYSYSDWGRTKEIALQNWTRSTKEMRYGTDSRGLCILDEKTYRKLSDAAKACYIPVCTYFRSWRKPTYRYYCGLPLYFFETHLRRAYITHRQPIDPDIQSRIDELENRLLHPRVFKDSTWHKWNNRRWEHYGARKRERLRVRKELQQEWRNQETFEA